MVRETLAPAPVKKYVMRVFCLMVTLPALDAFSVTVMVVLPLL